MGPDALQGTGSDAVDPHGFSIDSANPKYRQFKNRDGILEYTFEGGEITVDWVCGRNAPLMIQQVLNHEGTIVRRISGYVTDKLGAVSDTALQRVALMLARRLNGGWSAAIERIEGRRYLVFTR